MGPSGVCARRILGDRLFGGSGVRGALHLDRVGVIGGTRLQPVAGLRHPRDVHAVPGRYRNPHTVVVVVDAETAEAIAVLDDGYIPGRAATLVATSAHRRRAVARSTEKLLPTPDAPARSQSAAASTSARPRAIHTSC